MARICRLFLYIFALSMPQWIAANSWFLKSPFVPGWWYQFHDKDITVCPMFEGNNAKIGLWDSCDADIEHLLWKVVQGDEIGTFTLVNQKTQMCMTVGVDMQDIGEHTPVVQYECQKPPSDSQVWSYRIISRDDSDYTLLKCGDRCISNDNPEPGTTFYMSDCDGSTGQLMNQID